MGFLDSFCKYFFLAEFIVAYTQAVTWLTRIHCIRTVGEGRVHMVKGAGGRQEFWFFHAYEQAVCEAEDFTGLAGGRGRGIVILMRFGLAVFSQGYSDICKRPTATAFDIGTRGWKPPWR